jgi:hypothetical protein
MLERRSSLVLFVMIPFFASRKNGSRQRESTLKASFPSGFREFYQLAA